MEELFFYIIVPAYCAASTITVKSGALRDAPPISPPSMLGIARSSAAFLAFIEPPYWIAVALATALPYFLAITLLMNPQTSSACSAVAVLPVPIAQTGSYAMITFFICSSVTLVRAAVEEAYGKAVAEEITVQYGGSMNDANAAELLSKVNVDGGLIGGASLKTDKFTAIVKAANA